MQILEFKPEHHDELSEIWARHGWSAPSIDVLPKKGFVGVSDGKVVGASFIYISCSGMAFLDWVVVDLLASPMTRGMCVHKTVKECINYASEQGKRVVYTVTANQPLLKSYKKMGFQDMETNATTMALSIDGTKTDFLR